MLEKEDERGRSTHLRVREWVTLSRSSDAVRVERRGKSSPVAWRHGDAVNSIRSNTVEGHTGRPGRPEEVA